MTFCNQAVHSSERPERMSPSSEVTGGLSDAQSMFQQLSQGGTIVEQAAVLTRVQLPNGGFVQLRTVMSASPNTAATIDVNIPGLDIRKVKFNP